MRKVTVFKLATMGWKCPDLFGGGAKNIELCGDNFGSCGDAFGTLLVCDALACSRPVERSAVWRTEFDGQDGGRIDGQCAARGSWVVARRAQVVRRRAATLSSALRAFAGAEGRTGSDQVRGSACRDLLQNAHGTIFQDNESSFRLSRCFFVVCVFLSGCSVGVGALSSRLTAHGTARDGRLGLHPA